MLPTADEAMRELELAEKANPGPWVKHSVNTGIAARRIAKKIPAMDPDIDANTSGTTIQNIMLMNTVPKGLIAPANPGANQPTIQPSIIAPIRIARKR